LTAGRRAANGLHDGKNAQTRRSAAVTWDEIYPALLVLLLLALPLDSLIHPGCGPRYSLWRSLAGSWILLLLNLIAYGLFLAASGNAWLSTLLTLCLQMLFVAASNAKRAMLGEPLLFSDLALIGAIFRHPQFYLSALRPWQKVSAVAGAVAMAAALARLFVPLPAPHVLGLAICGGALALLATSLHLPPLRRLAQRPNTDADVTKLGLLPTMLLYWLRWRASGDPQPLDKPAAAAAANDAQNREAPPMIVVIQCESFADPVELFGDPAFALPGLESARMAARQWGNLLVSGFGAYTMRTEYGVLFGRDEEELGFRRFDPFLNASGDASYALPQRLGTERWRSLFVHPHDMRFYRRDRILPRAGFVELVGEDTFDPPEPGSGRYVSDAAMTRKIMALADEARTPTFLYAVTIENHGPWAATHGSGPAGLIRNYNRLVGAGDTMLAQLRDGLAALRRPALLVFFGDHRPSIPGASEPGGARHTPYVILQFGADGQTLAGDSQRVDLTPAQLHHAILGMLPEACG
jgi:hypothetical protein